MNESLPIPPNLPVYKRPVEPVKATLPAAYQPQKQHAILLKTVGKMLKNKSLLRMGKGKNHRAIKPKKKSRVL